MKTRNLGNRIAVLPLSRRGFTLLELLIALALMTMLAATLYSCLYIGFKARDAGARTVAATGQMFSALELLGEDFECALPPTGVLAGEFQGDSSVGGSGSSSGSGGSSGSASGGLTGMGSGLSSSSSSLNAGTGGVHAISPDPAAVQYLSFFTASNHPRDGELGADIRKVELSVETPVNETPGQTKVNPHVSPRVLMRRIYYNLLPGKAATPREQILCRNVHSFYLRYFDGTLWADSWDSQAQGDIFPAAIEVTLELDRPDATDDTSTYKMTRVFVVPCGPTAAQQANGGN